MGRDVIYLVVVLLILLLVVLFLHRFNNKMNVENMTSGLGSSGIGSTIILTNGSVGAVGSMGAVGALGAIGAVGSNSASGAVGSNSASGAVGSNSASGAVGSNSAVGAVDAIGSNGALGALGSVSSMGSNGSNSALGSIGSGSTIYYEPGNYSFNSSLLYSPNEDTTSFMNSSTGETSFSAFTGSANQPTGFCKKSTPELQEETCNNLSKDLCPSTSCCVLLGGEKCVAGNKTGPSIKRNYGDTFVKNKDVYFYEGECYGNCEYNNTDNSSTIPAVITLSPVITDMGSSSTINSLQSIKNDINSDILGSSFQFAYGSAVVDQGSFSDYGSASIYGSAPIYGSTVPNSQPNITVVGSQQNSMIGSGSANGSANAGIRATK
jgi:hypothetical protein